MTIFNAEYFALALIGIAIMVVIDIFDINEGFISKISKAKTPVKWCVLYLFMLGLIYILLFTDTPVSDASNFIYFNF